FITVGRKKVHLSNLDKVYWPEEGYLKGQMIAYYEQLAEYILPFTKDKPICMHRFPNGITKPGFFQKDVDTENIPKWLITLSILSQSPGMLSDNIISNDKPALHYIANLVSIEINHWLSIFRRPEQLNIGVLFLDPHGADFQEVINVAKTALDV